MNTLCPSFKNCGGCSGNVFPKVLQSEAPSGIKIMVIGDSPTAMEIRRREFLRGPAAGILKETMKKVGLPTDDKSVHFTTALKCAVPKRKGKTIPVDILRNCHAHIVEEIEAINPSLVLVLGKTAMQTVYGDTNIKVNSIMGRVTPIPGLSETINAIPVLHPALIQRSPGEYKPFLASLQLAAKVFNGGKEYDTGKVGYQVLRTEEMCDAALKVLANKEIVSADMETTGLDYRIAEFLVLGIGFEKNKVFVIPREMRHRVKDFFALRNLRWTWQHGKYDAKVIWRRGLGEVPHHEDVMYMHYVLDETSPHDLEHLSKVFLNAEAYKYKMNQNFKAIELSNYDEWFDALCERVAVDCDYTYQVQNVIREELDKEPPLARVYDNLMMKAAPFLSRVEQNGLLVDPELLEEYDKAYDIRLAGIMKNIEDIAAPDWDREAYMSEMKAKSAPDRFNPASPKQMSWMVFKKLKLRPRVKKGMSTAAAVLESIEPSHPLIDKVLEYRKVAKEQSTYVKGLLKWRDIDGRVRTNFSLHITATGRLSSKEPNVQNIPSAFGVGNIRRAFPAPKGFVLMESDYTGAELRWLAALSSCPVLLNVFLNGKNLHDETSVAIWGPDFTKQDRMRAKAVNFGIPYGREWPSFVDEFNISKEEAQKMIRGWLDNYYGARDYLNECAAAVTKGQYLETPFGRRRRFGLVTPESLHSLQNEARNFPIQSASSDTTLVSGMELETVCNFYGVQTVNLVHDSIMHYVPAEPKIITEFSQEAYKIMTAMPKKLFNIDVPFDSDVEIGFTWGDFVSLDRFNSTVTYYENKQEIKMDLGEWLIQEGNLMEMNKYSKPWYNELQPIPGSTPYQGGVGSILV